VAAGLLRGQTASAAHASAARTAGPLFETKALAGEQHYFAAALAPNLATRPVHDIRSGGHFVDTLTAGFWCLLASQDYRDTVLKAVNLGDDTDTTGIAAGALAGVQYGPASAPDQWRAAMARSQDLEALFEEFASLCGAA
jgi:ADP-ribosylglycohydrolase